MLKIICSCTFLFCTTVIFSWNAENGTSLIPLDGKMEFKRHCYWGHWVTGVGTMAVDGVVHEEPSVREGGPTQSRNTYLRRAFIIRQGFKQQQANKQTKKKKTKNVQWGPCGPWNLKYEPSFLLWKTSVNSWNLGWREKEEAETVLSGLQAEMQTDRQLRSQE